MKFRASSTPRLIAFAFGFNRQHGAEGKEKYLLVFSASMMF